LWNKNCVYLTFKNFLNIIELWKFYCGKYIKLACQRINVLRFLRPSERNIFHKSQIYIHSVRLAVKKKYLYLLLTQPESKVEQYRARLYITKKKKEKKKFTSSVKSLIIAGMIVKGDLGNTLCDSVRQRVIRSTCVPRVISSSGIDVSPRCRGSQALGVLRDPLSRLSSTTSRRPATCSRNPSSLHPFGDGDGTGRRTRVG